MMYIDFYEHKDEEPKIHINYYTCTNDGDEDKELRTFDLSKISKEELDWAMLTVNHIFPDFETDNKNYPDIVGNLKKEIEDLMNKKGIFDRWCDTVNTIVVPYFITTYLTKNAFYKLVEEGIDIAKHKETKDHLEKILDLNAAATEIEGLTNYKTLQRGIDLLKDEETGRHLHEMLNFDKAMINVRIKMEGYENDN